MTDTHFLIIACVVIGILLVAGILNLVELHRLNARLRKVEAELDTLLASGLKRKSRDFYSLTLTDPDPLTDPNYEVRVYRLGDLLRATRLHADGFKEAGDRTLKSLYGDSALPKDHFMVVTSLDTGNYTEQGSL